MSITSSFKGFCEELEGKIINPGVSCSQISQRFTPKPAQAERAADLCIQEQVNTVKICHPHLFYGQYSLLNHCSLINILDVFVQLSFEHFVIADMPLYDRFDLLFPILQLNISPTTLDISFITFLVMCLSHTQKNSNF